VPRFFPASRRLRGAVGLVALVAVVSPACGKKGPPLPPFSNVPGPPPDTSVRRKGDHVEVRFTVPAVNSDGRRPARIDRVEVYAATSEPVAQAAPRQPATGSSNAPATLTPPLLVRRGKLVGSVVVREPPPPPPEVKEGEPPPPPPPPRTDPGLDQGIAAVIVDTLSPADLEPTTIRELEKAKKQEQEEQAKRTRDQGPRVLTPPDYGPAIAKPPVRYYVVVGANGGDKGTPTQRFAVPVEPAPPSPSPPDVTVAEGHLELAWKAPEGLRRPILLTVLPPKAPATPAASPAAAGGQPVVEGDAGAAEEDDEDEDDDRPSKVPPAEGGIDAPRGVTLQGTPAGQPPTPAPPPSAGTGAAPQAPVGQAAAPAAGGTPAGASPAGVPAAAGPATPAPGAAGTTGVLPARLLTTLPNTTYTYAVYEVAPPNFTPAKQEEGAVPPFPNLLTPAAVATTTFRDDRFEVGLERCYAVSIVATTGAASVESPLSKPACVKAVDTFPPSAPTKLEAVASEGAISLIWEASPEPDVAGYLVLRGEAGGGQLTPLFKAPIKETTYRDVSVKRGVRYVYGVVAVDTSAAHNASPQSNHVEETAR
jgi:hypothetical protein